MDERPTLVKIVLNYNFLSNALIDNGCQFNTAISEEVFTKLNLPLIPIPKREVRGASEAMTGTFILGVTYVDVEIQGFVLMTYFYVVSMLEHPVILGKPWMTHNKAYPIPHIKIV